jgi:hypothetical protein
MGVSIGVGVVIPLLFEVEVFLVDVVVDFLPPITGIHLLDGSIHSDLPDLERKLLYIRVHVCDPSLPLLFHFIL